MVLEKIEAVRNKVSSRGTELMDNVTSQDSIQTVSLIAYIVHTMYSLWKVALVSGYLSYLSSSTTRCFVCKKGEAEMEVFHLEKGFSNFEIEGECNLAENDGGECVPENDVGPLILACSFILLEIMSVYREWYLIRNLDCDTTVSTDLKLGSIDPQEPRFRRLVYLTRILNYMVYTCIVVCAAMTVWGLYEIFGGESLKESLAQFAESITMNFLIFDILYGHWTRISADRNRLLPTHSSSIFNPVCYNVPDNASTGFSLERSL
jgi:hypothetical protein